MLKITYKQINFILGLLAVVAFHFYLKEDNKQTKEKEDIEYPFISSNRMEYKGRIIKRTMSGVLKNKYLFDLSSQQKFATNGFSFLVVGDSVYKPINTDTLYIFTKEGKRDSVSIKYNSSGY